MIPKIYQLVSQPTTHHTTHKATEANNITWCGDLLNFHSKPASLRTDYSFSYSSSFTNKSAQDGEKDYTTFHSLTGSIDEFIAIVKSGKAVSSAVFRNSYRKKENFIKTDFIILDVDNVIEDEEGNKTYNPLLTIEHCTKDPFLSRFAMVSTSPSHTPQWHRLRLYFALPVTLTDELEIKTLIHYLNQYHLNGAIDLNAIDVSRMFYGNTNGEWYNTDFHVLPFELITHCQTIASQEREILEKQKLERSKQASQTNHITNNQEIEKALSYISADCGYDDWITVGFALYHYFCGSDEGFALFDNWSQGGQKYDGTDKLYRKWQSFSGNVETPRTISSLFKIAIENGYTPPRIEGTNFKGFSSEAFKLWKIRQYELLTKFTPDITFNERFVNDRLIELDFLGKGTTVKSVKFSGKSYFLPNLIRMIKKPILLIGHRRLLMQNLAEDLKGKGIPATYLNDEYKPDLISSLVNNGEHLAIVVDSLGKLKDLDLSDYFIIVDESEQVTEAIGVSSTHIDKVRGKIWAVLSSIIGQCQGYLLMDADGSDRIADYWYNLNPQIPTQKIENTYRLQQRAIVYPSGVDGYSSIIGKLYDSLSKGKKTALVSDSESELVKLYKLFSPKYQTVLITAPNIADNPSISRFLSEKGKAIAEENIQLVLISPVAQSGLSIEVDNYFDEVFGLLYGTVTTNIARQMLIRVRALCTRHIWSNGTGLGIKSRFNWKEILATDTELNEYIKESIDYYKDVEKLSSLDALKKVVALMESGKDIQDVNNRNIAQCKAFINLNKSMYRDLLIQELQEEGYECTLAEETTVTDLVEHLKTIGSELKLDEAKRAYFAPSIIGNDERIEYLKRKPNLNENERSEYLKYQIEKTLPELDALTIPFILEYIIKDKFKVINGVQNFFLVNNPEIAKRLDFNAFSYAVSQCHQGGVFYLSSKKYSLLVDVWQGLNLNGLFGDTFNSESATDLLNQVSPRIRNILRSLGIRWNKNSHSVKVLSKIFQLFGFKTSIVKIIRGVRFYKIKPIELIKDEDTWLSIFNSINLKFSGELNKENDIYSMIQSECTQSLDSEGLGQGAVPQIKNNIISPTAPPSPPDDIRVIPPSIKTDLNTHQKEEIKTEKEDDKLTDLVEVGQKFIKNGCNKVYKVIEVYRSELGVMVRAEGEGDLMPSTYNLANLISTFKMKILPTN